MFQLEKRDTQTKVKHEILEEYLRHWGYIITSGLTSTYKSARDPKNLSTRFVYVDCFSFMGAYVPENNQPVYGSPIIGIDGLDKLLDNFKYRNGVKPETYGILIEEDSNNFKALLETLNRCGYQDRVKQTANLHELKPGDIAVINADYREFIEQILDFTKRPYTWSFYFLDPYGPKGIPFDIVSRVISQEKVDTIINLPYQDLHKKTGSAAKETPHPGHIPHLQYYDAMYGNNGWRKIAQRYDRNEINTEEMEHELVELYRKVLHEHDNDVALKRIPLKFPSLERTMYYLFLTTHDGTGALKMNEILDDAKISEYDHREKVKSERTQQMSLFGQEVKDPSRPQQAEYDIDQIADTIYQLCKGETITYKTVLARLADTTYYLEHIKQAMANLKRARKCSYKNLSHKELIVFA